MSIKSDASILPKRNRVGLVLDDPSDEDEFGTHLQVAKAIADLVRRERGGRAIGLAGRYGAGKSTVVKLAAAELGSSDENVIWIFDAWSHEGDPLRRSFLEGLIAQLIERRWLDSATWREKLEFLARRRREWTTNTKPEITAIGWHLAMAVLLVPLGVAAFSALFRSLIQVGRSTGLLVGTVAAGLAMVMPLLVLLAHWFKARRSATGDENDFASAYALLMHRSVSSLRTNVIESPEPTSVEFGLIFREAMKEALGGQPERRFVIVVDNLDRVPAQEAMQLWSTLQTFLGGTAAREGMDRLWVLMPYDESALDALWKGGDAKDGAERPSLVSAYLDKTFQVRFDVPPPLLSDWKAYTIRLLRSVIPAVGTGEEWDAELEETFQVFARNRGVEHSLPMPRDLKVFVNQVGSLRRQQTYDDIPLSHIAYYVQARRRYDVAEIVANLRRNVLLTEADKSALGSLARGNLAALAFGTTRERAQQLLLEEPISEALAAGDSTKLRELVGQGFWEVVQDRLAVWLDSWSAKVSANLFHAFAALSEDALLDECTNPTRRIIIREFSSAAVRQQQWSMWNEHGARGAAALVRVTNQSTHRAVVEALRQIAKLRESTTESEVAARTVSDLKLIQDSLTATTESGGMQASVVVGGPANFLAAVDALGRIDPQRTAELWSLIRPEDHSAALQHLASVVQEGAFSGVHRQAVKVLMEMQPDVSAIETLVAAIGERVRGSAALSADEAYELIESFSLLDVDQTRLRELAGQGVLAHAWAMLGAESNTRAHARLLMESIRGNPGLVETNAHGKSSRGLARMRTTVSTPQPEFVGLVTAEAVRLTRHADLLAMARHEEFEEFVRQCVGRWESENHLALGLAAEVVVEYWDVIGESASQAAQIVASLDLQLEMASLLARVPVRIEAPALYLTALAVSDEERGAALVALEGHIVSHLRSIDSTEWVSEFTSAEGGPRTRFAVQIGERLRVELDADLRQALASYGQQLVRGSEEGLAVREGARWDAILTLLPDAQRIQLRDQLLNQLSLSDAMPSDAFFSVFGALIWSAPAAKAGPSGVSITWAPLIEGANLPTVRWMTQVAASSPEWLDSLSPDHRAVLSSASRRARSLGEDDTKLQAALDRLDSLFTPVTEA